MLRIIGLALGLMVVAGALGNEKTSADSTAPAVSQQRPTLTLAAIASGGLVNGYHSLADVKGFFDRAGVDVTILDNTGGNTVNLLVSGRVDLATLAWGSTLALANQGRATHSIYSTAAGFGSMLVAGQGVTRIEDLRGKRIGSLVRGTTTYGFAVHYNEKFNLNADIVPYADVPTLVAALVTGRVDGATATPTIAALMASGGATRVLVDTRDPKVRARMVGPDYPVGGYIGLPQTLAEKRDAVVRFIRALEMTRNYVKRTSDVQLARDFRQLDLYKSFPETDLASLIGSERGFAYPANGYISRGNWNYMLTQVKKWGLQNYDSTNSAYEFSKNYDSSFLRAAGVPAGKPRFGKRELKPSQPVAGKRFTFTVTVNGTYSRQPMATGKLIATPVVSGATIPHVESFKSGKAQVSFIVPRSAKNKTLSIRIRVSDSETSNTRTYGFKVR